MNEEGVPFTLRALAIRGDLPEVEPRLRGSVLKKLLRWCAIDGRRNEESALRREAARLAEEEKNG